MPEINNFEEVLALLGDPGRYEIIIWLCMCMNYFPIAFNNLLMGIYGDAPHHHCKVPANMTTNETIPIIVASDGTESFDECKIYEVINGTVNKNITLLCEEVGGWFYYIEDNENSIVTEWDLVCDRKYLNSIATSIYFTGVMLGGLVFGLIADKYGRKPTMIFTTLAQMILGIAIYFFKPYEAFVVLRFFQGMLIQGLQNSTYILMCELFTSRRRTIYGTMTEVCWSLSIMWLSFMAYLLKDWRYIQLSLAVPSAITISFIWIVPESLRWLMTHNKYEKAQHVLKRLSKFNKVELPDCILNNIKSIQVNTETPVKTNKRTYGMLDALKTPQLRKRSLFLFFFWWAGAGAYYGISLNITTLVGNKYLNYFISGLVEMPPYLWAFLLLARFGRRKPFSFYLLLAGATCIAVGTIPKKIADVDISVVSTILALIGKLALAGFFSVGFLFSSELFPTVIRNIGFGYCTFGNRLGGIMAAPLLLLGSYTFKALPFLIYGSVALVSGMLSFLLPETQGKPMPDTIEEIEYPSQKHDKTEDNKNISNNLNDLQISVL